MLDLSIIIVSYNTKVLTKRCIESIKKSLGASEILSYEILVIDNASTDGSVETLKKLDVRLIVSKSNRGFGSANNLGVSEAKGKYILLLNSDTEAIEDAVPKLYDEFLHSAFDFGGAKLVNTDGSIQHSTGRAYTLPVVFLSLFLAGDSWITRSSPSSIQPVDWLSGACIITKKSTYQKVGGFDEHIFMYWEELDLFYRAGKKGYSTGFFPSPTFIHHEGASSDRSRTIQRVFEGYMYFYKKHFSPLQLVLLKTMLQLKSVLAVTIGYVTNNTYLKQTYSKAYEITKNN